MLAFGKNERPTSNTEHRIWNPLISPFFKKNESEALARSTLDVGRSMFNVDY
jgi:hypothetical protein